MTCFPIQFQILDEEVQYTGAELRTHWCLEKTGKYGSMIAVFTGPCFVPTNNLVDLEDQLNRDHISAQKMLHFIGEFFGTPLEAGVLYQRLFMVWAAKKLSELTDHQIDIERRGDDLFLNQKKLSVSIATASPVSTLIHWGINIDATSAPVDAIGLNYLKWDNSQILTFAKKLLTDYIEELEEIRIAQCKVRPII